MGRYDTNIGSSGELSDPNAALSNLSGLEAGWGVYGVHQGRRYLAGVDYSGAYRRYTSSSRRSGDDHFANLSFVYQISPRTEVFISPSAASYSFATSGLRNSLLQNSLSQFSDPLNNPFDSRTNAVAATGGLSHMVTSRTVVTLQGSGFSARQDDPALLDSQGAVAGGSVSRMLGPNKAIGASYNYFYFFFPNGFGESRLHAVTSDYMHELSDVWSFQLSAGGFRAENERLTRVQLDPLIAAITGQSALLQALQSTSYQPLIQATLGRKFQRGSLSFYYGRAISPGVAFTTTSVNERGGVQASYTATERFNAGFNFTAQRSSALTQTVGRFTSIGGGAGISYKLWRFIHLTARTDIRRWSIAGAQFERDRVSASVGLTFSPGERPLSLF
ncbi:MAG: hypothetical protein GY953_57455 [bacterium]|nr:hypothetical protein [bacterium]